MSSVVNDTLAVSVGITELLDPGTFLFLNGIKGNLGLLNY